MTITQWLITLLFTLSLAENAVAKQAHPLPESSPLANPKRLGSGALVAALRWLFWPRSKTLQLLDRKYRLVIYEDGGHGLREHEKEVGKEVVRWFKKTL